MTATSTSTGQKKSGLKILQPGQVLFNEGDEANSMFIIQKGQIRLFRPKGKGFVDIAVLRSGEVIGEMAYFDPNSRKRSASASAIAPTEVIEISFVALEKTMTALNPWFKTLINTLADRLRKSNERVRELESNSVGYSSDYKFFQLSEVVKLLSLFYFCYKSMSEVNGDKVSLPMNKLKQYVVDIFNIQEVKLEEMVQLFIAEKIMTSVTDEEQGTKILSVTDIEFFKTLQAFFNTQRMLREDKKMHISNKCEKFLSKVVDQTRELTPENGQVEVDLSKIANYFKEYNMGITLDDFQAARLAKFCGEYKMADDGKISAMVNIDYLNKMFPVVKFMNAINRLNDAKAKNKDN